MEEDLPALRALGLTEYGARAYAALVALGPSPAASIASAARVPRTRVYTVLGDLARRGWIDTERGKPILYRAHPPRECFDRERARLGAVLDGALPRLEARYQDRGSVFAGPLWLLQGVEGLQERAAEMLRRAKDDVLLVAPFPLPGDEAELPRAVAAALARGVRVRVMAPSPELPHVRALVRAGAEARLGGMPMRLLLVDGRQALLAFRFPRPDGSFEHKGIWNPSRELVGSIGASLTHAWSVAPAMGDASPPSTP